MIVLRVMGGLLLAGLICGVAGVFKEYFHLWEAPNLQYQWPIAMAASGAVGALIMAYMKPTRLAGTPAALPRTGQDGRAARPSALRAGGTSSEVPGMPTFDFDKARAAGGTTDAAASAGVPAKPQEKA
jgi:hypothetical protein